MDVTERKERILTMVNTLAQEAMERPRSERVVFIRRRIEDAGDTLTQAYASSPEVIAWIREFAHQLQQWTIAQVRALEQSRTSADEQGAISGSAESSK